MSFFSSLSLFPLSSTKRFSQNGIKLTVPQLSSLRVVRASHRAQQQMAEIECIGELLRELAITIEYETAELDNLPKHGAFLAMANQPSGLLDKLALLYLLGTRCPALRTVATARLKPLLATIAGVHLVANDSSQKVAGNASSKIRSLVGFLHNDVPLLLFPEREEEHRTALFVPAAESNGHITTGRLLKLARVPVVPVWVESRRTASFSWREALPPLRSVGRLPVELLSRRGQTVRVRVGQAVLPGTLARLPASEQPAYLRARLYALGPSGEKDEARLPPLPVPAVLAELASVLLESDIARLRSSRCLVRHEQWEVYVAHQKELPHVLREIGRLRELALRRMGAGTQQATDLDDYDGCYHQLFLYNRAAHQVVAACRIGVGQAIMREQGKQGFSLHALFRLGKALTPLLRQTLELSRLFVRAEYQEQPLPLALLWKGLAEYIVAHPTYCYVMGLVSISDQSGAVSKTVMMDYIRQNCFHDELAEAVRPRKRFRFRSLEGTDDAMAQPTPPSPIQDIQQLIAVAETGKNSVPALLRQYVRQNARFLGFTVDPRFSNTLNGFLLLDVRDLPVRAQNLLEHCVALARRNKV